MDQTNPEVQDIIKTWRSFLDGIIRSRDYRSYHSLTNFTLEDVEEDNIRRYKGMMVQKLLKLGADPHLLDHSD